MDLLITTINEAFSERQQLHRCVKMVSCETLVLHEKESLVAQRSLRVPFYQPSKVLPNGSPQVLLTGSHHHYLNKVRVFCTFWLPD